MGAEIDKDPTQINLKIPQRFTYCCKDDPSEWFFGVAFPSARSSSLWVLVASQKHCEADTKYTSSPEKTVIEWLEDAVAVRWIDKEYGWHDWSA